MSSPSAPSGLTQQSQRLHGQMAFLQHLRPQALLPPMQGCCVAYLFVLPVGWMPLHIPKHGPPVTLVPGGASGGLCESCRCVAGQEVLTGVLDPVPCSFVVGQLVGARGLGIRCFS